MSFSCPHYNPATDQCSRVRDLCVCGRPGCVLARNSTFAIPVEVRLREADAQPTGSFPREDADRDSPDA